MKKSPILLVLILLFIIPLSVASADTNKNLNISVFTMQKGEKPLTDVYNKFMQQQLDTRVELFGGIPE